MFRSWGLYISWVLALAGMLGSLYFSELKYMDPFHLCWFQRICFYPLVIILGIAAYRGDTKISLYLLPLVIIGFFIALYQVAIQEIPGWNPIDICGAGPSCSEKMFIGLGPITIPMLSAANFLVIALLLIATMGKKRT